jgi:hypothetical protein
MLPITTTQALPTPKTYLEKIEKIKIQKLHMKCKKNE